MSILCEGLIAFMCVLWSNLSSSQVKHAGNGLFWGLWIWSVISEVSRYGCSNSLNASPGLFPACCNVKDYVTYTIGYRQGEGDLEAQRVHQRPSCLRI